MKRRSLAFGCVIVGFAVAIAGIVLAGGGPTTAATLACYLVGSVLILRGYVILVLSSLPPRSDDRNDDT